MNPLFFSCNPAHLAKKNQNKKTQLTLTISIFVLFFFNIEEDKPCRKYSCSSNNNQFLIGRPSILLTNYISIIFLLK